MTDAIAVIHAHPGQNWSVQRLANDAAKHRPDRHNCRLRKRGCLKLGVQKAGRMLTSHLENPRENREDSL
ncbi:MAG: hypothetical protein AAFV72_05295 [Cyanobacteria bacterium J06635_1]